MLDSGIISVIATDTHDTDIRPPHMKVLVKQLQKNYPDSYVRLWMSENPSRILKGLPVIQEIQIKGAANEKSKNHTGNFMHGYSLWRISVLRKKANRY